MNLPRATTNFYFQEYRDITLNTKLGKNRAYSINPILQSFEAQNDLFFYIFGQNQANLRMARNQKFQLQLYQPYIK